METSAVLEHRIGEIRKKMKREKRFEVQRRKVKRSFSFLGLYMYFIQRLRRKVSFLWSRF